MPDNADDKPLATLANTQENLSEESISINATEVVIPDKENIIMDVHHHAHHEGKKNWKSYAWEFLMLFFAVFCGFLAEYFLEHRIEKERGNQYVRSMIEDIVYDSTKIDQSVEFRTKQELGLDSLSVLFSNPPYSDSTIKRMYVLMVRYTMNVGNVAFTKRTVSQLKNSGGMRLIANKLSADEITQYCEWAEAIELQGEYFRNNAMTETINLSNKVFYLKYIKGVTHKNIDSFMMKAPIKLASNDPHLLIQYSNQLYFTSEVLQNYNSMLTRFKSEFSKTIESLKKENHIE